METIRSASFWLSSLALVVSLAAALPNVAEFLFPNSRTFFAISSSHWAIGTGRLGTGPFPLIEANFQNQGTRPLTVSNMAIIYFNNSNDRKLLDCKSSERYPTVGVPWEGFFRGRDLVRPSNIVVPAKIAFSESIVFEPWPIIELKQIPRSEYFKIWICVQIEYLDHNQTKQTVRAPVGTLWLDKEGVVSFEGPGESASVVEL